MELNAVRDWFSWFSKKTSQAALAQAHALVKEARRGSESIKLDLEKALDVINALGKTKPEDRDSHLSLYSGVMRSIETTAADSRRNGHSLIDGSGYETTVDLTHGNWQRALTHQDLSLSSNGLDLPKADVLTDKSALERAQKQIATAMSKVNRALATFNSDLDAIDAQIEKTGSLDDTKEKEQPEETVLEIVKTVAIALAIAITIRTFLFQPFNIPSGSMKSTLLVGDYLFVSKYAYGYSHKSLPFSIPLFRGRIFEREPKRGDVVVFRLPKDGKTDYIKRLIGLPGDTIQMKNGVLFVNGVAVPKEASGIFVDEDKKLKTTQEIKQFRETLPNGVSHSTLDATPNGHLDNTGQFRVPAGHYFFMGDNRDNSSDSRVPNAGVGYVPAENLVGRAEIIFFSVDGRARLWEIWKWPITIRYSRLFKTIE